MLNNTNTQKGQSRVLRCAIYTRKSHEEGLEQDFNSLDAQREASELYILSQKMQGWTIIPEHYDDGGFSGGNMERPALKRFLADIDAGLIDIIVVYKIDRLSRSLLDFMKMIELFNEREVSFVSVTQHFSTTDPTGRMFLGILITFAQYEREIIGERIRDKVAASKRRGKYCGGPAVLGYDVDREEKRLLINPKEAQLVKLVFQRYIQLGAARAVAQELNEQGYTSKSWTTKKGKERVGGEWNTMRVYKILNNRTYLGEIAYKEQVYPAEHEAIIDQETWDKAQALLKENTHTKISKARAKTISPLSGVIRCGHCDSSMGITYTSKGSRRYSYYICEKDSKRAVSQCPLQRVPAGDIESVVMEQLGAVFRTPSLVAQTYFAAKNIERKEQAELELKKLDLEKSLQELQAQVAKFMTNQTLTAEQKIERTALNEQAFETTKQLVQITSTLNAMESQSLTEKDVADAFQNVEGVWEELFPLERNRLIQLLVDKITIKDTGIDMELKTNGVTSLVAELTNLADEASARTK